MCISTSFHRCDGRNEAIPVILDGRNITRIDTTVAKNLTLLHMDLEARQQKLILWKWCNEAKKTLTSYDSETAKLFRSSGTLSQVFSGKSLIKITLFIHKLIEGSEKGHIKFYTISSSLNSLLLLPLIYIFITFVLKIILKPL